MRTILSRGALLFAMFSLTFLSSCNNEKKEETAAPMKEEPLKASSARSADQVTTTSTIGPFTILKLDKDDLVTLFQHMTTKKLLIQFSDDGGSFTQAVAFATRSDNVYTNVSRDITPASGDAWDTTGTKILGNNELTKKQIQLLIGGTIDPENAKDLYFYPSKNANNQIYYVVSTQFVAMTANGTEMVMAYPPGQETKPSPPAPPCSTNCE